MKHSRSGARIFAALLLKGLRVDGQYSLVVILVITGLFSTPLALGSIRNRVYVAVREQIEKENNARELSLQAMREDAPPLDEGVVAALEALVPGLEAVGNHKLVVGVEGPEGADLSTLQTLEPGDPRRTPLQIDPDIPATFGLADLVVSDGLGRLLYGEAWDGLWGDNGAFSGPPLALRINDLPLAPPFRVVARRRLPGRGIYASSAACAALRRYTRGYGAPELGLPLDPGLVEAALPRLSVSRCWLLFDPAERRCDASARERLFHRFAERQFEVEAAAAAPFPPPAGFTVAAVRLTEAVEEAGKVVRREVPGDCREVLAPHLVGACDGALVVPDVTLDPELTHGGRATPLHLVGLDADVRLLLPGAAALRDRHGTVSAVDGAPVGLTVAADTGLAPGEPIALRVGEDEVPARVEALYACPGGTDCLGYADPLTVLRLIHLGTGTVRLQAREPLTFVPADDGREYDEILAYVPDVETVEATAADLAALYPGYNVQYNAAALDKLRRQDSRLAALFSLTMVLSSLFLVLALAALARINLERRNRQIAQMLILGFSRGFVRRLVVAEYLLLTLASSLAAVCLTALLCRAARTVLATNADKGGGRDFQVIVDSMAVDPAAFGVVFAVVAVCTWTIAVLTARRAADTDPLNLLD